MSLLWALAIGVAVCVAVLAITTHGEESFSLPLAAWLVVILVNLALVWPWAKWVVLPLDVLYLALCLVRRLTESPEPPGDGNLHPSSRRQADYRPERRRRHREVDYVPAGTSLMRVRHVGFFSDLPHGIPSEPTLRNVISADPHQDEDKLVKYLTNGKLFIASPGLVRDELSDSDAVIGSPDILTDGVWAWPRDLAYYVSRYHVRLPEAFVEHAKSNQWTIPDDVRVELLVFEL